MKNQGKIMFTGILGRILSGLFLFMIIISCNSGGKPGKDEDGGLRNKKTEVARSELQEFFNHLEDAATIEEEAEAINQITNFLNCDDTGNSIQISRVNVDKNMSKEQIGTLVETNVNPGKLRIECPSFPPVAIWTDHKFISLANLEFLLISGCIE